MLKDGTYAAWFKTPAGQGTGIVHVANGRIWGRDSIMSYEGSCTIDGDRFTATVKAQRHTDGQPTVFGDDRDLELSLDGQSIGRITTYVGTAKEFPGALLEGTLIYSEPPRAQEATGPMPKFNLDRLPKLPARGR